MKILICAATPGELAVPMHSHTNTLEKLITGVGIAATAFNMATYLSNHQPDVCLMIGIAGSYDRNLSIGTVVNIQEDCFADLGAENYDGSIIHLTDLLPCDDTNPFEQKWIKPALFTSMTKAIPVKGITVNKTNGSQHSIDQIMHHFNPQVESMEGAAFFASCMYYNIPCMQLRAISNQVQPRNREAWDIPLAMKHLRLELQNILTSLDQ